MFVYSPDISKAFDLMQKLEPTNFDEESLQIMTFHESLQWSEPGKHNYRGVEISGKREIEEDALKCKSHILCPCFHWNIYQNDLKYQGESNICMYEDLEALVDGDDCKNCCVCKT